MCRLNVGTNNIRDIIIVIVLTKERYRFKKFCELDRSRSVFCNLKMGKAIVYVSYECRISESAVSAIAIAIAALGVVVAFGARFTSSGPRHCSVFVRDMTI